MGLRVEDPAEVRPALEKALASSGPALVDVVTDPNVLAMPPKATMQQAKGFALAMTKMAFAGEAGGRAGHGHGQLAEPHMRPARPGHSLDEALLTTDTRSFAAKRGIDILRDPQLNR